MIYYEHTNQFQFFYYIQSTKKYIYQFIKLVPDYDYIHQKKYVITIRNYV